MCYSAAPTELGDHTTFTARGRPRHPCQILESAAHLVTTVLHGETVQKKVDDARFHVAHRYPKRKLHRLRELVAKELDENLGACSLG